MSDTEQNLPAAESVAKISRRSTYPPWVALLLSLLFPGAGQFLAGQRIKALKWFLGLCGFQIFFMWSVASPLFWGKAIPIIIALAGIAYWITLLVNSWQRIPRFGFGKWLLVLGVIFAISLLMPRFWRPFLWPFKVPTGAMEPTIQGSKLLPDGSRTGGDHIMAERYVYWYADPKRGDIVVFENRGFTTALPNTFYVKRVIGVPGESLSVRNGKLFIDGSPIEEPPAVKNLRLAQVPESWSSYLKENGEPYKVPARSYFVIGDNTANSSDSRLWGPVPRDAIIGRVSKAYWPWSRAGVLLNPETE